MDIWANFKQYSLDLPIIITMDIGVSHFRCKEFFDAIICDPPYGLRAPIKTSEKAKDNNEETKAENEENKNYKEDDIKSNKTCDDMIKHLFNLARDLLRKEGKLVFLYPVVKEK